MSAPTTPRKPPARTYVVQIAGKAAKQLSRLPKHLGRLVANAIAKLADSPFPPGSKQLQGDNAEILHRIRIGDYRVIYEVRRAELVVLVVKVGNLRDVYR
jgi:mRNA interferase RelE/StbE